MGVERHPDFYSHEQQSPVHSISPMSLSALNSVAAVLLGWLGAGCSPGDAGPSAIVQDSAGVEMVRHGSLADYDRPVYPAEYIVSIGAMDGPPEMLFGEIAGVEVLQGGTVAVLDRQASEVRTYSLDGSFIRRISRRGSGPGEISGDATLGLVGTGSGRFALPDVINQTVSVFGADGDLVASHHWDIVTVIPEWKSTGDTTLAVRIWSEDWEVLAHRSVTGTVLDTLAVFAVRPSVDATDGRFLLFPDRIVWSTREPGEVAAGWMSEPRVALYRQGQLVRAVSWVPDESRLDERQHEMLLGIVARNMGADRLPPDVRVQLRLPERLPAVADIETSEELILVQRVRPVEAMDERVTYSTNVGASGFGGPLWDVFSCEGEYLGILDLGAPADVFDIRGDTILGVREDSLGVQQAFLARLPAALRERP